MKAPIPDHEEELIFEYIHLDFLISTLENDLKSIESAPLKIKEPYLLIIEETLKKIRSDLKTVKEKMKEFDIKVFPMRRVDDMFVEYPYFAHGYKGINKYWDAALKFASTKQLQKYFGEMKMPTQSE
jgi:hypothetical protein